jgi:hypothetical protein
VVDLRGWPCLCLQAEWEHKFETGDGLQTQAQNPQITTTGFLLLADRLGLPSFYSQLPRLLPLRPIWPGFAINTLFYAAILWLLFAAPFALRRMRRIKRGLCPACAYPVGTSAVCTECGEPVNSGGWPG